MLPVEASANRLFISEDYPWWLDFSLMKLFTGDAKHKWQRHASSGSVDYYFVTERLFWSPRQLFNSISQSFCG